MSGPYRLGALRGTCIICERPAELMEPLGPWRGSAAMLCQPVCRGCYGGRLVRRDVHADVVRRLRRRARWHAALAWAAGVALGAAGMFVALRALGLCG